MDHAVKAYADNNSANVLICWEHKQLTAIASKLGVSNPPGMCSVPLFRFAIENSSRLVDVSEYPDDSFNLIWTIQNNEIVSITSEDCPGLDPS